VSVAFRDHVLRICLQAGRLMRDGPGLMVPGRNRPAGRFRGRPGAARWSGHVAEAPLPRAAAGALATSGPPPELPFLGADISTAWVGSPSPTPNWKILVPRRVHGSARPLQRPQAPHRCPRTRRARAPSGLPLRSCQARSGVAHHVDSARWFCLPRCRRSATMVPAAVSRTRSPGGGVNWPLGSGCCRERASA
jgi:hypothetical protein